MTDHWNEVRLFVTLSTSLIDTNLRSYLIKQLILLRLSSVLPHRLCQVFFFFSSFFSRQVFFLIGSRQVFFLIGSRQVLFFIGPHQVFFLIGSRQVFFFIGSRQVFFFIGSRQVFFLIGSRQVFFLIGSRHVFCMLLIIYKNIKATLDAVSEMTKRDAVSALKSCFIFILLSRESDGGWRRYTYKVGLLKRVKEIDVKTRWLAKQC